MNKAVGLMLSILIFSPLADKLLYAIPLSPVGGGFLDLREGEGGYYYANDDKGLFEQALKNDMTIEFWVYLTRPTKAGEWWNLIAKPLNLNIQSVWAPMYGIIAEYQQSADGSEYMNIMDCGYRGCGLIISFSPNSFKPRWLHIAWQGKLSKDGARIVINKRKFVNGKSTGAGSSSTRTSIVDMKLPLYVGGLPPESLMPIWREDSCPLEKAQTFDGLIDELRISNTWRYVREEPKIRTRFNPDKWTVALWHFDEGEGAMSYADASGNGHTLLAGGSLTVLRKEKLPICWGRLKKND
jgi:hypothetical protein